MPDKRPTPVVPIPLVWIAYGLLLVVGVPWYWRIVLPQASMTTDLGVPLWVAVSLGASVLVSFFTAGLFLIQPWRNENESSTKKN